MISFSRLNYFKTKHAFGRWRLEIICTAIWLQTRGCGLRERADGWRINRYKPFSSLQNDRDSIVVWQQSTSDNSRWQKPDNSRHNSILAVGLPDASFVLVTWAAKRLTAWKCIAGCIPRKLAALTSRFRICLRQSSLCEIVSGQLPARQTRSRWPGHDKAAVCYRLACRPTST